METGERNTITNLNNQPTNTISSPSCVIWRSQSSYRPYLSNYQFNKPNLINHRNGHSSVKNLLLFIRGVLSRLRLATFLIE